MNLRCKSFLSAASMALMAFASSANAKVQFVEIESDGQTIPVVEIFQETANGQSRYTILRGGGFPDDTVNLRVKVAGKCKFGYEISAVRVDTDFYAPQNYSSGVLEQPVLYSPILFEPDVEENVDYTDGNRTLGERMVDFRVPLENFAPLLQYGNEQVARGNVNPLYDWTFVLNQPVSVVMRCARAVGYTGLSKWYAADTVGRPVQVIYRGSFADFDLTLPPPGTGVYFDPSLPNGQLADQVDVEAQLFIVDSEEDANACQLNLSGVFETNGETVIFYRLVDDRGVTSPVYKVAVDQTDTGFVSHRIDLSDREPEGPFPATDRGFSAVPTDRLQGFYQIEVLSPFSTTSNIASYNLEPCSTRTDTIRAVVGNRS